MLSRRVREHDVGLIQGVGGSCGEQALKWIIGKGRGQIRRIQGIPGFSQQTLRVVEKRAVCAWSGDPG